MPKTDATIVMTTVATADEAEQLVRALLERGLIACGTILPAARSLYRWNDAIADEREQVIMLKSRRDRVAELERAFEELHPYKVPELLAIPVESGIQRYLDWIADETSREPA
jgi:periplasmic divalent cation tolerance protein